LEEVKAKETLYLEGFWQSFEYYKNSLKMLSDEISLKDESNLKSAIEKISFHQKESVAVHIRRGDYLSAGAGISVLSKEYYVSAVNLIKTRVTKPVYFIFSDDIAWVKEEMGHLFEDVVYAPDLHLSDYEEFSLMKECKHAIIANSTFSWFSVLLTDREDKVVIYSNDWKNEYLNGDNCICPKHWTSI
jgi:hypothetical protein